MGSVGWRNKNNIILFLGSVFLKTNILHSKHKRKALNV